MINAYSDRRQTGELSSAIRPEILAAKLAAIRNLEYPQLANQIQADPSIVEKLWFIQWVSMQPGGLAKFVNQLLSDFPGQIGTEMMLKLGVPKFGKYNLKQCLALWNSVADDYLEPQRFGGVFAAWQEMNRFGPKEAPAILHSPILRDAAGFGLKRYNYRHFHTVCLNEAKERLSAFLASLCNEISKSFSSPWYCPRLFDVLSAAMGRHAENSKKALAMTAVARKVFYEIEFAASEKSVVQLFGDSRFGKTEAVEIWSKMYPGRARFVEAPAGNSDLEFFRALARALGINHEYSVSRNVLKDKVDYVAQHSGLLIIWDEAHRLIPFRFTENTPPMRMEWVRSHLIDNGNGCVFVMTPQAHRSSFNRFVRKTKYAIEQWTGRIGITVSLPNELEFEDLVEVARIHFPEFDGDYLGLIASKAMQSESYLKAVEDIAKRARYIARTEGHPEVTVECIEKAIRDVFPDKSGTVKALAPAHHRPPPRSRARPISTPIQTPCNPSAGRKKSPAKEEEISILPSLEQENFAVTKNGGDELLVRN